MYQFSDHHHRCAEDTILAYRTYRAAAMAATGCPGHADRMARAAMRDETAFISELVDSVAAVRVSEDMAFLARTMKKARSFEGEAYSPMGFVLTWDADYNEDGDRTGLVHATIRTAEGAPISVSHHADAIRSGVAEAFGLLDDDVEVTEYDPYDDESDAARFVLEAR
jgi:hypothetical protein